MQLVALNFQTSDVCMAVNQAMFEQSGNCGYELKPRVLRDETHPLYNKFNPLSKDVANQSALIMNLTVLPFNLFPLFRSFLDSMCIQESIQPVYI